MTCGYATWDGSYVLGALSPADRELYEQHLAGCTSCAEAVRDLAGLPGLLARVDEQAVAAPPEPEPAPDTLLPRLVREVRRERRRRGLVAAGLAAAAVAVVVAGAVLTSPLTGPEPPTASPPTAGSPPTTSPSAGGSPTAAVRAMERLGDAPVAGWLTLETVPWGTRLTLQCTYEASPDGYGAGQQPAYVMVVRTRDGGEQEVATWNAVPGRSMQLTAATATRREQITAVEVRTGDGRPVLRLQG